MMCSFIVLVSEIPASVSLIVHFMQILESLINEQDSKVQEGKIVHKEKIEDVLIFSLSVTYVSSPVYFAMKLLGLLALNDTWR